MLLAIFTIALYVENITAFPFKHYTMTSLNYLESGVRRFMGRRYSSTPVIISIFPPESRFSLCLNCILSCMNWSCLPGAASLFFDCPPGLHFLFIMYKILMFHLSGSFYTVGTKLNLQLYRKIFKYFNELLKNLQI